MRNKNQYEQVKSAYEAKGNIAYLLDVFGDTIAEREGYKAVDGIEAVHFYIVHKFKWLPSVVRSMSADDLLFLLTEEMHGWTAPREAL